MTNLDRRTTILLHIQKYCKEINENLDFFGSNFNTFFQIGELTKELDRVDKKYIEETKNNIPWQSIIKMRERFAHHYGEMDLKMIFNTAIEDIPILNDFLTKELSEVLKDD